jgi:short-subunit dehydrogenase
MTAGSASPQRILITGASSGIGAALAVRYAEAGVDLLLVGRDGARLRSVALQCSARGASVNYVCADVRDADLLHQWILEQDRKKPIDLVIANAGISGGAFGVGGTEQLMQVRAIMDVNVGGVMNTVSPLIPRMVARGRGQIAIMSSLAGFLPLPGAPTYAASKGAVRLYGLSLRQRLSASGIRVNVICPGFVETPMTAVNPYRMPFLMDGARAARIIRSGLARNHAIIAFPWPMAFAVRLLGVMPYFIQGWVLRGSPNKPPLGSDQPASSSL